MLFSLNYARPTESAALGKVSGPYTTIAGCPTPNVWDGPAGEAQDYLAPCLPTNREKYDAAQILDACYEDGEQFMGWHNELTASEKKWCQKKLGKKESKAAEKFDKWIRKTNASAFPSAAKKPVIEIVPAPLLQTPASQGPSFATIAIIGTAAALVLLLLARRS